MQKKNKLLYRNIEDALTELNAQDKGRYFLCTCPECQQQEAFIYKNNPSFIQCNRENQCGERMILQFNEKEEVPSFKTIQEQYPSLTKGQSQALDWITRFINHMQSHFESPTLDKGYRGLSKKTTEPFVADLISEAYVKRMFECGKELFPKNYAQNEWMCKRNLVFPIYGDDGYVERILLRSSIDPDIEPKELQLIVNPSKETRDFFMDIKKETKTIVISEAILDAASFREADPAVGILALTGAAKTKRLSDYLLKHKGDFQENNIILAMDNDEAGMKATRETMNVLDKMKLEYQVFPFPSGIKDANQYLNEDKKEFTKTYQRVCSSFRRRKGKDTQIHRSYSSVQTLERGRE